MRAIKTHTCEKTTCEKNVMWYAGTAVGEGCVEWPAVESRLITYNINSASGDLEATVTCRPGYQLHNNSQQQLTVRCLGNVWDTKPPHCLGTSYTSIHAGAKYVYVKPRSGFWSRISDKDKRTPDSDLTNTYSTLADSRSCGVHGRLFGHAWLHPWVIDTLSYCRQCGRHKPYERRRGMKRNASFSSVTSWQGKGAGELPSPNFSLSPNVLLIRRFGACLLRSAALTVKVVTD